MANNVTVFIEASGIRVTEIAKELGRILNLDFEARDAAGETIFVQSSLGLDLTLAENIGMVDDAGIAFTKYSHAVSVDVYRRAGGGDCWEPYREQAAKYIGHALFESLGTRCLVVRGAQRVIATIGGS